VAVLPPKAARVEDSMDDAVDDRHHGDAHKEGEGRERIGARGRVRRCQVLIGDADDLDERHVQHDARRETHRAREQRRIDRRGAKHEARTDASAHAGAQAQHEGRASMRRAIRRRGAAHRAHDHAEHEQRTTARQHDRPRPPAAGRAK